MLRVCRRRQAGNSDDSTQLTMKYNDKPSGPRTIRSKHAVEKRKWDRGRIKHYSLLVESGGSGWASGDFVLCGKRWVQGEEYPNKVVEVVKVIEKSE